MAEGDDLEVRSVEVAMISQKVLFSPDSNGFICWQKSKPVETREPRKVRLGYAWVLSLLSRLKWIKMNDDLLRLVVNRCDKY